jgi:hypothetical protein
MRSQYQCEVQNTTKTEEWETVRGQLLSSQ